MSTFYKERYGQWTGDPRGKPPDYTRCAKEVGIRGTMRTKQCERKAGYGPGNEFCSEHDTEGVSSRQERLAEKRRADRRQTAINYSAIFLRALEEMADAVDAGATVGDLAKRAERALKDFDEEYPKPPRKGD